MPLTAPQDEAGPRQIRVRHAELSDAAAVAPLLCVPRPGLPELLGPDARRAARALFRSESTLESHRYAWIAEAFDGLVAVAVPVPGEEVGPARVRTGLTMMAAAPWRAPRIVTHGQALDRLTAPVPQTSTFLAALAVRDDARGRMVGRTLLQTILAAIAHDGRRRLCLDVGIENGGARRFYDHMGFFETSRERAVGRTQERLQTRGLIRLEKTLAGLDG